MADIFWTSAFLDLSFGLAPAILGLTVGGGYGGAFVLSGAIALAGALALVLLRGSLARPVAASA